MQRIKIIFTFIWLGLYMKEKLNRRQMKMIMYEFQVTLPEVTHHFLVKVINTCISLMSIQYDLIYICVMSNTIKFE